MFLLPSRQTAAPPIPPIWSAVRSHSVGSQVESGKCLTLKMENDIKIAIAEGPHRLDSNYKKNMKGVLSDH